MKNIQIILHFQILTEKEQLNDVSFTLDLRKRALWSCAASEPWSGPSELEERDIFGAGGGGGGGGAPPPPPYVIKVGGQGGAAAGDELPGHVGGQGGAGGAGGGPDC